MVAATAWDKLAHFAWRRSIRTQLVLGFALASLVLMLAAGYHGYRQQRDFLYQFGQERAHQLAQALSTSATSWVIANDLVGLQELVQGFVSLPDLRRAYFLDLHGQVLASTHPSEVGLFVHDARAATAQPGPASVLGVLVSLDNLVVVSHPVQGSGRQLGWVRVEMTHDRANANLAALRRSWAVYIGASFLGITLLALLLARRMTRGLTHLTRVTHEIAQGRSKLRSNLQREDEIGVLARNMNRMLDELDRQKSMFRGIIDAVPDIIVIKDSRGVYLDCNAELERLMGRKAADIIGKTDFDLFTKDLAQAFLDQDRLAMERGESCRNEEVLTYPDGRKVLVETIKTPYRMSDGTVVGIIAVARDITERKMNEEAIRNLAFNDALTGLPNRRLLMDRLALAMTASKRSGRFGVVLFLDLDNFKPLNDTHGHDVGDLLLREVARRISTCIREADTAARFGGDEFVVMVPELDSDHHRASERAHHVAESIRSALAQPYRFDVPRDGQTLTVEHHCTASMGAVLFLANQRSGDEVIKLADQAMYRAKDEGRNRVCFTDL